MRRPARPGAPGLAVLALALGLLTLALRADAQTTFDFVTFDGIDYIRWVEEPGRALARGDLGGEFAAVECSISEDPRQCSYGLDAAAAFLPTGTLMFAVRGYRSDFRLGALVRDRVLLYQAWRNRRARKGGDLYDIAGKVRAIDVQRGRPSPGSSGTPSRVAPGDAEALVAMIVGAPIHPPRARAFGEGQYWLTLWLADGTTLGRPYFTETSELMDGLALPPEFRRIVDRYVGE